MENVVKVPEVIGMEASVDGVVHLITDASIRVYIEDGQLRSMIKVQLTNQLTSEAFEVYPDFDELKLLKSNDEKSC